MPWFRVDDGFNSHPDVLALLDTKAGPAAVGLWLLCGSYCSHHLTDGRLPKSLVRRFGCTKKHADALCRVGLWDEVEGGYQFRNWSKYQPTAADVRANRESARARMKRKRSDDVRANERRSSGSPPDPTRPDPNPIPPVAPPGGAPPEPSYADRLGQAARVYAEATGQTDCCEPWSTAQRNALAKLWAWCSGDPAKLRAELERLKRDDPWLTGKRIGQWAENLGTARRRPSGMAPCGTAEDFADVQDDFEALKAERKRGAM